MLLQVNIVFKKIKIVMFENQLVDLYLMECMPWFHSISGVNLC